MRNMICVGKVRSGSEIIGYELEEIGGTPGKKSYGIEYLRTAVAQGEMQITNLYPDPNGPGFLPVGQKPPEPVVETKREDDDKPARTRKARRPKRRKRGRR